MEVSQPVPLQPSWHTQYQPLLPRVHLPFPLHRPGQPSVCVCDKIGGEVGRGRKRKKRQRSAGDGEQWLVTLRVARRGGGGGGVEGEAVSKHEATTWTV